MKKFIHVFAYYIVWFGSIFLAKEGAPWAGLTLAGVISFLQVLLLVNKVDTKRLVIFLLMFVLIGFAIDTFFSVSRLVYFDANPWDGYLAPPWILGLWFNFAILCFILRDLLSKFYRFLPITALLGFPLAYQGGVAFGVAVFSKGLMTALLLGLIWMIVFPFLFSFCEGSHLKHD